MGVLEALQQATTDDLALLDARIAQAERELKSLREARKVVALRLHGDKPRVKKPAYTKSARREQWDELRGRIHDLLSREGSMPAGVIGQKLGEVPQRIGLVVREHPWFEVRDGEVHVARNGR